MTEMSQTKKRALFRNLLMSVVVLTGCIIFYVILKNHSLEEETGKSAVPGKPYYFLADLQDASILSDQANYVKVNKTFFTIKNERRPTLFEQPDTELVFKNIRIKDGTELQFGIGMREDTWDKAGDGVLFEVIIIDQQSQGHVIFSQYIDPKHNVEDRRWFDYTFDLQLFARQQVAFIFKVTAGPKKNRLFDWAGWSNPQLVVVSHAAKESEQSR